MKVMQNEKAIIASLYTRLLTTAEECDLHDGVTQMDLTDAINHLAEDLDCTTSEVRILLRWRKGDLSEGQAAEKLGVNRLKARTMLEPLKRNAPRKTREQNDTDQ